MAGTKTSLDVRVLKIKSKLLKREKVFFAKKIFQTITTMAVLLAANHIQAAKRTTTDLAVAKAGVCGLASPGAEKAGLTVWAVDPLVKVFRDAEPDVPSQAIAEVARGEHATLQIVVRSDEPIKQLHVEAGPLVLQTDESRLLNQALIRFVSYVPVDRPIPSPPLDQLRKPPADFPDPLLEKRLIDIDANQAQPIWITVAVPTGAKAGLYQGDVHISGQVDDGEVTTKVPVAIKVFDVVLGRSRLWVTNWFSNNSRHMQITTEENSLQYWALLHRYARNMAEHRQNVALISPLSLASFEVGKDGKIKIDFSMFDRWVDIFIEEGVIGRIEGGHIGGRSAGWESPFVVRIRKVEDGKIVTKSVDPSSTEAEKFYARFLPAFVNHLRDRGWLEKYMQHLADEPIGTNIESYRAIDELVQKYAPELKIVEACHTKDLIGAIDVWVPQLNYLHRDFDHYQERQREGEEVWFYTCIYPQGEYANRFIEQPLLKTRILHWINYRYGVTGYLHWGYNHWGKDSPYTHTTKQHVGSTYLPAGDAWIVYPGREGPLDSMRHEAMRDGIADYELLSMLAERDPAAAKRLVGRHVLDFDRYNCSIDAFRATRRELLEFLSGGD